MSDHERTPERTARVNSERFASELAAVWYAANFYYAVSQRHGREYIGVVFRTPAGKYGFTVRGDGGFLGAKVRIADVPVGTVPTAVWHTHIKVPPTESIEVQVLMNLLTAFDLGYDQFSGTDRNLADRATAYSLRKYGHPISIYLATATVIRRYRPGSGRPEQSWGKEPPGQMRLR